MESPGATRRINQVAPVGGGVEPPQDRPRQHSRASALKALLTLAAPTVFSYSFTLLVGTASIVAVGRSGSADMQAGYGLGLSVGNVMVLTIGFGLASGMDTLCPQAIGRGRGDLCWRHYFRGLVILSLAYLVLFWCLWYSHPILVALKQPHLVAMYAQDFLRWSAFGFYGTYLFEVTRKFLIHFGCPKAPAVAAMAQLPIHCTLLYVLIFQLKMEGPKAAGLARSLSMHITLICLLAYLFVNRERFQWSEYLRRSEERQSRNENRVGSEIRQHLRETGVYLRVAIPSAILLFFEWISFEAQIFECSYFGAVELAAYTTMNAFNCLIFMVPMGLGVSLSSYVGSHIGSGELKSAWLFTQVGLQLSAVFFVAVGFALLAFRKPLSFLYSANPDVQRLLQWNFIYAPFCQFVDGMQGMLCGVVKGLGLQAKATYGNAIGMLGIMQAVGIGLAYGMGYAGRGLIGGAVAGLGFVCIYLWCLVAFSDWDDCVAKSRQRELAMRNAHSPIPASVKAAHIAAFSSPPPHAMIHKDRTDLLDPDIILSEAISGDLLDDFEEQENFHVAANGKGRDV